MDNSSHIPNGQQHISQDNIDVVVKADSPGTENFYKRCISLPMYPSLSSEEQDFVIEKVKEFIG